jgi:hypothetical protein
MTIQNKIELYFENKLSSEEKAAFEREILTNPTLYEEIEKRKEILNTLSQELAYKSMFNEKNDKALLTREQEIAMEEDIIAFHKEYIPKGDLNETQLKRIIRETFFNTENRVMEPAALYRIAASLIIFVIITGSSFFLINHHIEKKKNASLIATQFFLPENDDFLIQIRHSLDLQRNAIEESSGDSAMMDNMKELLRQNLLLIEAVSDMENKDFISARKKLGQLFLLDSSEIRPAVSWYYALLLSKEGNYKEASRVANGIKSDNNYYSAKADSLLLLIEKE